MFTHEHAIRTRPTIELENGKQRTIYVIETDLAITPDDPAFDEAAFNDLVEAAVAYLADHEMTYDCVRVDSVRGQ